MPNYLIGVLAQAPNNSPGISVNACTIDTTFFDEIFVLPSVITVNACNIDVSTMNVIFDI
jgi:hypothetical protein